MIQESIDDATSGSSRACGTSLPDRGMGCDTPLSTKRERDSMDRLCDGAELTSFTPKTDFEQIDTTFVRDR